jgi:hypothetical protein
MLMVFQHPHQLFELDPDALEFKSLLNNEGGEFSTTHASIAYEHYDRLKSCDKEGKKSVFMLNYFFAYCTSMCLWYTCIESNHRVSFVIMYTLTQTSGSANHVHTCNDDALFSLHKPGLGEVWIGELTELSGSHKVAVKRYPSAFAEEEIEMFRRGVFLLSHVCVHIYTYYIHVYACM